MHSPFFSSLTRIFFTGKAKERKTLCDLLPSNNQINLECKESQVIKYDLKHQIIQSFGIERERERESHTNEAMGQDASVGKKEQDKPIILLDAQKSKRPIGLASL